MGIIKTKGIVTKIVNYSDTDKILTVISAELGKIQVFCKGAKKAKGAVLASSEFLAYSEFVLFEGRNDMYNMSSAEIIEVFYELRIDFDKLSYASTIAQIMNDVSVEDETCYKKLQLFLNTLYTLSKSEKSPEFVYAVFQIRLLGLLGFVPRLGNCTVCNNSALEIENKMFSIKENGIKCESCARADKGAIRLSEIVYTSLLYILSSDAKKIFSFEIPELALNELKVLAQIYFTEKLEKEYKVMKI